MKTILLALLLPLVGWSQLVAVKPHGPGNALGVPAEYPATVRSITSTNELVQGEIAMTRAQLQAITRLHADAVAHVQANAPSEPTEIPLEAPRLNVLLVLASRPEPITPEMIRAKFEQLPEPDRTLASIFYEGSQVWRSTNAMLIRMATEFGIDSNGIRQILTQAKQLEP